MVLIWQTNLQVQIALTLGPNINTAYVCFHFLDTMAVHSYIVYDELHLSDGKNHLEF